METLARNGVKVKGVKVNGVKVRSKFVRVSEAHSATSSVL